MRVNPVLRRLGANPLVPVRERARQLRAAGMPVIDFSIGDPREATPDFIPEALREAVPSVSQYPTTRGLAELRGAIAGYVRRRFGVDVDPESQVLPTTGSKEAIFSTPLAFVDRADPGWVIYPTPGYPIYERGAALAGARLHPVRLEGEFVFRADQISSDTWKEATLAWICSPHNPAGSVMSVAGIGEFVDRCREHEVLLCADECYADLYERAPAPSVLEVAGRGSGGVLSFLSLSKRSGMTGYRSGAVVGDAEAIAALVDLRTLTGTAPPEFTQAAAVAAWSDDRHVEDRRRIFSAKRAILRQAFDRLGLTVVGSEAGLYLWVRVGDDLTVTERLLGSGVVVSPGRVFGEGGEGFVRLALVPPPEECARAAEVIIACLTES